VAQLFSLAISAALMKWHELKSLAYRCKTHGDLPRAIEHLAAAVCAATDANPLDIALMHNGLADLYLRVGDAVAAEKPARESLRIELEFGDAGRETTNVADYYVMLARVLETQQRFGEAADYVSQALPIFTDLIGSDSDYTDGISKYQQRLEEMRWRG
jgi:tetratricopeptide (TPR) repeat protein